MNLSVYCPVDEAEKSTTLLSTAVPIGEAKRDPKKSTGKGWFDIEVHTYATQ